MQEGQEQRQGQGETEGEFETQHCSELPPRSPIKKYKKKISNSKTLNT